jgi:hypothetical protein
VPPLRHAVRLVDREQRDLRAVQQRERRLGAQPLRREVEQVKLAGPELLLDHVLGPRVQRGVEEVGADPELPQRFHLVLHQRDQRGDDHAGARSDQRGDLVAERLAPACRHQHERIPAAGDVVDDLLLRAAEALETEHAVQHRRRAPRAVAGTGFAGGGHAAILRSPTDSRPPQRNAAPPAPISPPAASRRQPRGPARSIPGTRNPPAASAGTRNPPAASAGTKDPPAATRRHLTNPTSPTASAPGASLHPCITFGPSETFQQPDKGPELMRRCGAAQRPVITARSGGVRAAGKRSGGRAGAGLACYSMTGVTGVPSSTVRLTVQSCSWDRFTASGSSARALSPSSPSGKAIRNVTTMSAM